MELEYYIVLNLLNSFGVKIYLPIPTYEYNSETLQQLKNNLLEQLSRTLNILITSLHEHLYRGIMILNYVESNIKFSEFLCQPLQWYELKGKYIGL